MIKGELQQIYKIQLKLSERISIALEKNLKI